MPVRDLTEADLPAATTVLVRAFDADPALRWLLPDSEHRRTASPVLARCWLRYGMRYGRAWCTDRVEAVAVRRPPGSEDVYAWGLLRSGGLSVLWALGVLGSLRLLLAAFSSDLRHADGVRGSHWYCWLLAVHPDHQGKGHASELVSHTFAHADADRVPCFLEATNPRSVEVHRRHGWRVASFGTLPGTDLAVWGMVRSPAGA